MSITTKEKIFLMLVRRAMFSSNDQPTSVGIPCSEIDWRGVLDETAAHAMTLTALEGTDGLECEVPEDILAQWQGRSVQYIIKNETLMSVQDEMLEILRKEGISGAVIKGSAASACYRNPDIRTLGDIDFLVREKDFERTVALLEQNGFVKEEQETNPCHTELSYSGCVIEVHKYVNGLPDGELGEYIKSIYEDSLENDLHKESVGGYTFPVTNDLCGALTLIIHTQGHVLISGLGMRHLCDWAAFVDKKLTDELKAELEPVLEKIGLFKFYKELTATCEKFLLSDSFALDDSTERSSDLCDMLFLDFMFCGNFGRKDPAALRGSIIFTRKTLIKKKDGSTVAKVKLWTNIIHFIKVAWPITQKHAILIPVGFVYIPVRYLFRVVTGKRKMMSTKFISTTTKRNDLYGRLDLYKTDGEDV